jgi:hypothetical protein
VWAGSGKRRRGPAGRGNQEERTEAQGLGKAWPLGGRHRRRGRREGERLQAGQVRAALHARQLVRGAVALALLAQLPLHTLGGTQQHEAAFAHLRQRPQRHAHAQQHAHQSKGVEPIAEVAAEWVQGGASFRCAAF